MKLLLGTNNVILDTAHDIQIGIYDEPFEKYALFDADGNIKMYALLDGFTVAETDEEVPDDYIMGKYCFVDGEIVDNPDYEEPPKPVEEVVEELAESMEETEGIVDTVLSDILPSHNTSISELEDMMDFLLTGILPNLMG